MTLFRPIIAGPYLDDLLSQPEALNNVCGSLAEFPGLTSLGGGLQTGRFRRVVLTGMGSSLHALYPLHLQLITHGWTSHWIESSELLQHHTPLRSRETLLVAVSQSGESAEIVRLMESASAFGHVVGVTNQPESTLGRAAQTRLLLHAGVEATVSCKTYLNTLAVLHWLGAVLTGDDSLATARRVAALVRPLREYLDDTEEHVAALAPWVEGVRSSFIIGRGVSLATAGTGGLILKESTRQHAEGMSAAAFRHGPLEMAGGDVLVVVLEGVSGVASMHRRLVEDVRRGGGRVALVAAREVAAPVFLIPAVGPALLPLVEILPVQMLSLAIAARDGREAGRFERASKVTTAE